MSNKQPTAVEWLYNELFYFLNSKSKFEDADEILERAKEMEKEQSIEFAYECQEMFKHEIKQHFEEKFQNEINEK